MIQDITLVNINWAAMFILTYRAPYISIRYSLFVAWHLCHWAGNYIRAKLKCASQSLMVMVISYGYGYLVMVILFFKSIVFFLRIKEL